VLKNVRLRREPAIVSGEKTPTMEGARKFLTAIQRHLASPIIPVLGNIMGNYVQNAPALGNLGVWKRSRQKKGQASYGQTIWEMGTAEIDFAKIFHFQNEFRRNAQIWKY